MVVHNEANKNEIAKNVIMPGDPLRAKFIAENFLEDYKLVNETRNMFAYTGKYKGKEVTVMGSGMGMPSMGIYSYELFKFYDVENIIRIGSCGAYSKELSLMDLILVEDSYTIGNYALGFGDKEEHSVLSSKELNNKIEDILNEKQLKYVKGSVACTECFDPYIENLNNVLKLFPEDKNIIASEMESFALFFNAKKLNKKASCILTVVDSIFEKEGISREEREKSLNNMIETALDTVVRL